MDFQSWDLAVEDGLFVIPRHVGIVGLVMQ